MEFYEARAGRGEDFLNVVEATYARVMRAPETFSPVPRTRSVRSAKVEGYPFRVFFVPIVDGVLVLAAAHERRRPGYWKPRLEG